MKSEPTSRIFLFCIRLRGAEASGPAGQRTYDVRQLRFRHAPGRRIAPYDRRLALDRDECNCSLAVLLTATAILRRYLWLARPVDPNAVRNRSASKQGTPLIEVNTKCSVPTTNPVGSYAAPGEPMKINYISGWSDRIVARD